MVDRVTADKTIAWVVGVGASRGLGAAAARRFAREGFAVAVTGRSPEALAIIADEISSAGGHAIAQRCTCPGGQSAGSRYWLLK
jgi:short-subunit dehydrogenase